MHLNKEQVCERLTRLHLGHKWKNELTGKTGYSTTSDIMLGETTHDADGNATAFLIYTFKGHNAKAVLRLLKLDFADAENVEISIKPIGKPIPAGLACAPDRSSDEYGR